MRITKMLLSSFVLYIGALAQNIHTEATLEDAQTITGNKNFDGGVGRLNKIFFVDGTTYTTIQSAIIAAGSSGFIIIPAGYTGTDNYMNASGIQGFDFRGNEIRLLSTNFGVGTGALLASSFPHGEFPLGSDLGFRARGPADIWLLHNTSSGTLSAVTSTTTSLAVGANNHV